MLWPEEGSKGIKKEDVRAVYDVSATLHTSAYILCFPLADVGNSRSRVPYSIGCLAGLVERTQTVP